MCNVGDSASTAVTTERESSRTLEDVGAVSVLTAMVEQKRRSSIPAASEVEPLGTADADEVADTERAPARSNAFLETR